MSKFKNRSGICSSTSVSGGYSMLSKMKERKFLPRISENKSINHTNHVIFIRFFTKVCDGHRLAHGEHHRKQQRRVV